MSDPLRISDIATTDHIVVRMPQDLPYTLAPEEEAIAIRDKENALRNHRRWSLIDKGGDPAVVDRIIETTDWSAEYDRTDVLASANKLKYWKEVDIQAQAARKAKLAEDRQRMIQMWTAAKVYQRIAAESCNNRGRELLVNEHTLPLIKVICFRISEDTRFITELRLDPYKGLLLRGPAGTGKSYLIDCIKDNPRHPIQMHSMIEISQDIIASGTYHSKALGRDELLYIDDVGTEYDQAKAIKHYGQDINWFKNFIEGYYMKSPEAYNRLIISTNDSFDTLQYKYGFRVRSRLAQMFNIIDVTGPDMRKISNT